jgi:hypothetical protein
MGGTADKRSGISGEGDKIGPGTRQQSRKGLKRRGENFGVVRMAAVLSPRWSAPDGPRKPLSCHPPRFERVGTEVAHLVLLVVLVCAIETLDEAERQTKLWTGNIPGDRESRIADIDSYRSSCFVLFRFAGEVS